MTHSSDSDSNEFGNRLRQAREYVGLSREEVAKALGLPSPSIINIEVGARAVEKTELGKLAKLYRRKLEYLLTGVEPAPNGPEQLAFLARSVTGLHDNGLEEVERLTELLEQSARKDNE